MQAMLILSLAANAFGAAAASIPPAMHAPDEICRNLRRELSAFMPLVLGKASPSCNPVPGRNEATGDDAQIECRITTELNFGYCTENFPCPQSETRIESGSSGNWRFDSTLPSPSILAKSM